MALYGPEGPCFSFVKSEASVRRDEFEQLRDEVRAIKKSNEERERVDERSGHLTQLQIAMQSTQLKAAESLTEDERQWWQRQVDALEWAIRFIYKHGESR